MKINLEEVADYDKLYFLLTNAICLFIICLWWENWKTIENQIVKTKKPKLCFYEGHLCGIEETKQCTLDLLAMGVSLSFTLLQVDINQLQYNQNGNYKKYPT